jgi:hypothetical protein
VAVPLLELFSSVFLAKSDEFGYPIMAAYANPENVGIPGLIF